MAEQAAGQHDGEHTSIAPSRQTSVTVWIILLLLAALAWAILIQQTQKGMGGAGQEAPDTSQGMAGMGDMNQSTSGMSNTPQTATTTGASSVSIALYLPLWVVMMVAMMFPAVAPVVSFFTAISQNRRAAGQSAAPPWIFVVGYLAVWSLLGVGAYLLSLFLPALSMMAPGLRVDSPVIAGVVLIFAGIYQLTPLKQVCLQHCRSPLGVILHGWHDGNLGAFRMGFAHGAFCVGCCWGLMLVLLVVGMMNLVAMVVLSAIIFLEKIIPRGPLIARLTAIGLIIFGVVTLAAPIITRSMG